MNLPLNPSRNHQRTRRLFQQTLLLSRSSRIKIFLSLHPIAFSFPQGHERIGGSRFDGAVGHVSGSGYAATSHRGGHADRRITLPIDLLELVEQSSQHEPTDQHVEYFEYDESSCWTGNDEIRAEEDDKRVQDQGERFPFFVPISATILSESVQSSDDKFVKNPGRIEKIET